MDYLLEAENCLTAAHAAIAPDERAEYLRRAAYYRNLALEVMVRPDARQPASAFENPCVAQRRAR